VRLKESACIALNSSSLVQKTSSPSSPVVVNSTARPPTLPSNGRTHVTQFWCTLSSLADWLTLCSWPALSCAWNMRMAVLTAEATISGAEVLAPVWIGSPLE